MSRRLPTNLMKFVLVFLLTIFSIGVVYLALPDKGQPSSVDIFGARVTRDSFIGIMSLVASTLAATSALWNVISSRRNAESLEELKHQNAESLEELKQELSIKNSLLLERLKQEPLALKDSRDAAIQYYRTLKKMETQVFTSEDFEKCEQAMEKAELSLHSLSETYQNSWYSYWQIARNISTAASTESQVDAKEHWISSWAKDLYAKLTGITSFELNS